MKIKTTVLILFTLTFLMASGQNPPIKKEIKLVSTFNYDYVKDGKRYLSRKGAVKIDTSITEYKQDGTPVQSPQNLGITLGKVIYLDSTIFLSIKNSIKHEREYWSDTTFIDIYTQNFKDSIIQIKISSRDTIQINKSFFYKGKLVKTHKQDFRDGYGKFNEQIIYEKKSKSKELATIITTRYKGGITDTIKVNNKKNVFRTMVLNKDKNEWYVKSKERYYAKKMVGWKTFYHNYHNRYFTIKTTKKYNTYGLLISEEVYDTYLKHIEKKSTYSYEYY